jgi:glucosamine--fructose-6-phosphate aminotransferase (isomerizing)
VEELKRLGDKAEEVLKCEQQVKDLAAKVKDADLFFFLGRGADAHVALEGALKMKEIAYVATQESPAGEMKHGPLALVQPGVVSIFGATDATIREKVISNMKEVEARSGTVVAITTAEDDSVDKVANHVLRVPRTPYDFLNALLAVIPEQLLAYHIARLRGCEIDQPRNLAKSVTVE